MPIPELFQGRVMRELPNRMCAAASGRGFDPLPVPGARELLGKEIA